MENEKPHIIIVAYHFPPSTAVGGRRLYRFYKYLKRMGYTCHVVTASAQPSGGPADVTCVTDHLGLYWESKVRRSLTLGGHFERVVRRFLIPGCVGLVWSADAARECLRIAHGQPGRKVVLLTSNPPVGASLVGLLVTARKRVRWIADFRDPMTFGYITPMSSWLTRLTVAMLERTIFRFATAAVANVESAGEVWRRIYPWSGGKLSVIWNGFDPEDRNLAEPLPDRPERVIIHAGDLYEGRNPNMIIEGLARLRAQGAVEALRTHILLVGSLGALNQIDWTLCDNASREGWLEIRKPVTKPEADQLVAQSAGLLLVQPQTSQQVPAKLFEYISIGRPILALVPPESAVEYVLENSGIPYRCILVGDSPQEIDRKILEYLRLDCDPVPFSQWFESRFDARRQTEHLASIIEGTQ